MEIRVPLLTLTFKGSEIDLLARFIRILEHRKAIPGTTYLEKTLPGMQYPIEGYPEEISLVFGCKETIDELAVLLVSTRDSEATGKPNDLVDRIMYEFLDKIHCAIYKFIDRSMEFSLKG